MNNEVKRIHTPLDDEVIKSLKPGDMVLLSGKYIAAGMLFCLKYVN